MGHAGTKYIHEGIEYDSPEETYFAMWVQGLKSKGYVKDWRRNEESYEITPAVYNKFKDKTTKKPKDKQQTILQNIEYKPDFVVYWDKSAKGIFYNELGKGEKIVCPFIAGKQGADMVSVIEIKPTWDVGGRTRSFRHIQKFIFFKKQEYVNLIFIEKLFDRTYTPYQYQFTKTGKKKVINKWIVRSLEEFLATHDN